MRLMRYLNDNGDIETVETYGYAFGLGSRCKEYYEAYSEDRGWFLVPIDRVFPVEDE